MSDNFANVRRLAVIAVIYATLVVHLRGTPQEAAVARVMAQRFS